MMKATLSQSSQSMSSFHDAEYCDAQINTHAALIQLTHLWWDTHHEGIGGTLQLQHGCHVLPAHAPHLPAGSTS